MVGIREKFKSPCAIQDKATRPLQRIMLIKTKQQQRQSKTNNNNTKNPPIYTAHRHTYKQTTLMQLQTMSSRYLQAMQTLPETCKASMESLA